MDDEALSGDLLPPALPPASVALVRRLSRGKPSRDLQALTQGKVGEAVGVAARYADAAISEVTREAYVRHWADFEDWCKAHDAIIDELPVDAVLVAAYLGSLAKTHGASALRGRVAAIAYHHGVSSGYVQKVVTVDRTIETRIETMG